MREAAQHARMDPPWVPDRHGEVALPALDDCVSPLRTAVMLGDGRAVAFDIKVCRRKLRLCGHHPR
jgi:hypothetical protein